LWKVCGPKAGDGAGGPVCVCVCVLSGIFPPFKDWPDITSASETGSGQEVQIYQLGEGRIKKYVAFKLLVIRRKKVIIQTESIKRGVAN
jgi:hypothetical protein